MCGLPMLAGGSRPRRVSVLSIVLHQSRGCTNPSPSVSDGDVSVAGLAKFVGLRDRYHQPGFCYFREVAGRKPIPIMSMPWSTPPGRFTTLLLGAKHFAWGATSRGACFSGTSATADPAPRPDWWWGKTRAYDPRKAKRHYNKEIGTQVELITDHHYFFACRL